MLRSAYLYAAALALVAALGPTRATAQFHDSHAHLNEPPGGAGAPASDGRGELRVHVNVERATVKVDGEVVGSSPYRGRLGPGRHRVEVESEGLKRWRGDVQIAAGQTTQADVELHPEVSRGGAWGMLTMTALSAGAGVTLWYFADQLHADLTEDMDAGLLASNDPRIRKGRWMTIGADIAFGTALLFGVLSLYYFVRDPYPDSSAEVHRPTMPVAFTPLVDPLGRSGGAELRWSF